MTDNNPFQFARIFETECGKQILAHVDTDSDDNPALIFSVYLGGGLGRGMLALSTGDSDKDKARADARDMLKSADQEMAEKAYRQIVNSSQPMIDDKWLAEHFSGGIWDDI